MCGHARECPGGLRLHLHIRLCSHAFIYMATNTHTCLSTWVCQCSRVHVCVQTFERIFVHVHMWMFS